MVSTNTALLRQCSKCCITFPTQSTRFSQQCRSKFLEALTTMIENVKIVIHDYSLNLNVILNDIYKSH